MSESIKMKSPIDFAKAIENMKIREKGKDGTIRMSGKIKHVEVINEHDICITVSSSSRYNNYRDEIVKVYLSNNKSDNIKIQEVIQFIPHSITVQYELETNWNNIYQFAHSY